MDAGAEDVVFYSIFPDFLAGDGGNAALLLQQLEELRLRCLEVTAPLVQDYVWQYAHFDLRVVNPEAGKFPLPFLGGQTRYGHNVEDAWFVVYLLLEISRKLGQVSIRVWDTDGEFLLIEAAYEIPVWLESEASSRNRVFIRQGAVHILPLPSSSAPVGYNLANPSLMDSLKVLASGKVETRASERVQMCISRRVGGYPRASRNSMHRVKVKVPLRVAQVLKHEPQLVALAVEAFYRRCQDDLVAAARMTTFLTRGTDGEPEMVTVVVTMSRAMYAQLVLQVFHPPRSYPMPPLQMQTVEDRLGMKLACGFEMMYAEHKRFQDGQDGDGEEQQQVHASLEHDVGWQAFRKKLEASGYFRNLLEGSREHRELFRAAAEQYRQTDAFVRVRAAMQAPVQRVDEILALEHSVEDFPHQGLPDSDNDSWLYRGEEELTNAMQEGQKQRDEYQSQRAARKKSDETGREMASKMKEFVDKTSSFEGAEVPSDEVKLDMARLFHELKSVMGEDEANKAFGTIFSGDEEEDRFSSGFGLSDEEDEDASDMEEEDAGGASSSRSKEEFMEEYTDVLEQELNKTSIVKSFDKEGGQEADDMPVDVDFNLVKSLLESYSSQQGLPGPASNLLGLMGMQLPDDSKDVGDASTSTPGNAGTGRLERRR